MPFLTIVGDSAGKSHFDFSLLASFGGFSITNQGLKKKELDESGQRLTS